MKTRTLGTLEVSALGLGCMGMSTNYGPSPERADLIAFTHSGPSSAGTLAARWLRFIPQGARQHATPVREWRSHSGRCGQ